MKKFLIVAAALCLLLVGCTPAPGTSLPTTAPGTSGTQPAPVPTTVPETTVPETTAPTVPTTESTVPGPSYPVGTFQFTIYTPNETLDGFTENSATISVLHPQGIMFTLTAAGFVNKDITANSAVLDGTQLNLDLNQAFLDQLVTMGATGEKMLVGAVVNTFLSAYQCETVMLTVNGETIDSGHVIYDSPLSFFE